MLLETPLQTYDDERTSMMPRIPVRLSSYATAVIISLLERSNHK